MEKETRDILLAGNHVHSLICIHFMNFEHYIPVF